MVVPTERPPLAAEALFRFVRSGLASFPDDRLGDTELAVTDALMSACAMFSRKSPSLLALDQQRAEGTLQTICGLTCVPCDPRMRELLDPLAPESLRPLCQSVLRHLQRGKARESLGFLEDYS